MIDLLKVCSHFSCPSIDELSMKFVNFGQPTRAKVLVLDMDETLIHARFLQSEESEQNDNGDFIVSIANTSGSD
jgi:TFIIF-interacting CTD phosphatase-like protein